MKLKTTGTVRVSTELKIVCLQNALQISFPQFSQLKPSKKNLFGKLPSSHSQAKFSCWSYGINSHKLLIELIKVFYRLQRLIIDFFSSNASDTHRTTSRHEGIFFRELIIINYEQYFFARRDYEVKDLTICNIFYVLQRATLFYAAIKRSKKLIPDFLRVIKRFKSAIFL